MKIIDRLRGGSSALETIAIVGIGGIGKTTLARKAYNHPLVMEHFEVRSWSAISARHDWRQLDLRATTYRLSVLMNKSTDENITTNADDSLFKILHEVSGFKRYLIVLDDISSIEDMEMLRLMLPDCRNGSRIILTTRSMGMSSSAHFYIHIMGLLDDDKAWDLLQRKILKGDPCPSRLEYVGKMIARRCKGHPLSIEVISGILAADQTEVAWEDVSENMYDSTYNDILMPPEVQNLFTHFELLNLSYRYLPHHLRPCFLYLGTFPKKEEMHVSKLIKLWVAEGFLNQSECKSFEVVGEECVEDLVRRSLVSVSKRKSNGRIKSITIHDLMWDVCLRRAQEDNFILHHRRFGRLVEARKRQWCRRVCNLSDGKDILKGVYGSTIRSIFYGEDSYLGIGWSVGNVRLLRILDLTNVYYRYFPDEILQLFHLRYLALRIWSCISQAVSNLQNLQTLIIGSKKKGSILPEGIWRLPQLRHLLNFCLELPREEGALSALENLQTLCTVKDFVCSRENLKVIPNLKKLAIFYTENFRNVGLQNLIYMQKLEILKIEMEWSFVEQHKMSYAFPSTLTKLNLCGLQLPWEDMKMVASLPNLEVLKLRNHACLGNTWETSEGGFSELTFLLIEESDLDHWITETTHFPKLKCLVLRHCLYLLEVPNGIGEIPTLESIELDEQNQSLLSSAKRIQNDQRSLGNDRLRVHVV